MARSRSDAREIAVGIVARSMAPPSPLRLLAVFENEHAVTIEALNLDRTKRCQITIAPRVVRALLLRLSASATLSPPRAPFVARRRTSVLTVARWDRSGVRVPVTTTVSRASGAFAARSCAGCAGSSARADVRNVANASIKAMIRAALSFTDGMI